MYTTILFDLDGTLIDTEKYFKVFWRKAVAELGYEMSEEQALTLRSLGRPYAPKLMKEWFGEEFDYVKARNLRRKMMQEHLQRVGLERKKGAGEALAKLKEMGFRLAVATATPTDRAREQLKEVGLLQYFEDIVSAADVENGKPAPDVYIRACEILGEKPENCLAVEDSPNGVLSAYRAGVPVVMIPDQTPCDAKSIAMIKADLESLLALPHFLAEE